MTTKIHTLSAGQLAQLLRKKELSAIEIAHATLDRIAQTEPRIEAFLSVCAGQTLADAAAVDARLAAGEVLPPLAGIPVAVKDNICTKGVRTSCASRMLAAYVPPYDATVVEKLRGQGALLVGKTNLDEFAMGSSCEHSAFQKTHNPWDTDRTPGGSSGGSAAAVAACQVPLALGSDTGGSIRVPAGFCGVVGLKPTYGAVSRYGLVAFASSLDQIGPFARTARDAALLFGAIAGRDARDATSRPYTPAPLRQDVRGLKIGLPKEYFAAGLTAGVQRCLQAAVETLRGLGAEFCACSLPSCRHALPVYNVLASAQAASNLGRYDGLRYGHSAVGDTFAQSSAAARGQGFGEEVQRRVLLGTYMLRGDGRERYYRRAKLMQQQIAAEFAAAFADCDLLAAPVNPAPAFRLGENLSDPVAMYAADLCTVSVNLAGLPGLSVPCGLAEGLPVGLQLIGPAWSEAALLGAAACYEDAVGGFAIKEVTAP